jgi:hypothetical protein
LNAKEPDYHVQPGGTNPRHGRVDHSDELRHFHFGISFMSLVSFAYGPSANKAINKGERTKIMKLLCGIAFDEALASA